MDLKVQDVADLLNVPESTIQQWIEDGKIPCYRMNQHYYFSKAEIENWVISHQLVKTHGSSPFTQKEKTESQNGGYKQFSLFRAIHKGDVLTHVLGNTKEETIRLTMKMVSKKLHFDADVMTELLLDREQMMPTALNNGVGVPHTRDTLLNAPHDVVIVVFPNEPLDYGALDGLPVHTLFFLFACKDKSHLHLLAKIAHLSSQMQTLDFCKTKPSKEDLLAYVKEWEGKIGKEAL